MSIQHVAAVLHSMPEIKDRGAALTLMTIADSADRASGWTFDFSMRAIAAAARMSIRGVRDRVRWLEREGYLRCELTGPVGQQKTRFQVLFDFDGMRLSLKPYTPPANAAAPPAVEAPSPGSQKPPPRKPRTPPPAVADTPPAPPIRNIRLSPSVSEEGTAKSLKRGITKKMPKAEPAPNVEPERQRQLAELAARMSSKA